MVKRSRFWHSRISNQKSVEQIGGRGRHYKGGDKENSNAPKNWKSWDFR